MKKKLIIIGILIIILALFFAPSKYPEEEYYGVPSGCWYNCLGVSVNNTGVSANNTCFGILAYNCDDGKTILQRKLDFWN